MAQTIVFAENNRGRQVFRCPDIAEAPAGSMFHFQFDLRDLKIQKQGRQARFYNPSLRDTSAVAQVGGDRILVGITESEIRSFQVFKTIEFDLDVTEGVTVGFERGEQSAIVEFTPEDLGA